MSKVRDRLVRCMHCTKQVTMKFRYGRPVAESLDSLEKQGWVLNMTSPLRSICGDCNLFKDVK